MFSQTKQLLLLLQPLLLKALKLPKQTSPIRKKNLKPRPFPDLSEEVSLGFFASKTDKNKNILIIGVDEVGRGCLAGPVVAAAVALDEDLLSNYPFNKLGKRLRLTDKLVLEKNLDPLIFTIQDSKLIPEADRAPLAVAIKKIALGFAIAEASVIEIETINILQASLLAMQRAVEQLEKKLKRKADHILIDGNRVPRELLDRGIPMVKGDQRGMSIACASIIAKVFRDEMMEKLDLRYPGYGLAKHKGYGTPFHLKQIIKLGATELHRKTFKGVRF